MSRKKPSIPGIRSGLSPDRGFLVCLAVSLVVTLALLAVTSLFRSPESDSEDFILVGSAAGGGGGEGPVIAVIGGEVPAGVGAAHGPRPATDWLSRVVGWVRADQVVKSDVAGVLPRIGQKPEPRSEIAPAAVGVEFVEQSIWDGPAQVCVMVTAASRI